MTKNLARADIFAHFSEIQFYFMVSGDQTILVLCHGFRYSHLSGLHVLLLIPAEGLFDHGSQRLHD